MKLWLVNLGGIVYCKNRNVVYVVGRVYVVLAFLFLEQKNYFGKVNFVVIIVAFAGMKKMRTQKIPK